jgi:hypothetical protein
VCTKCYPETQFQPRYFCYQRSCYASSSSDRISKKSQTAKIFSTCVNDPRKGKVLYSLESLLQTALATVLFRMGSKRAFHQEGRESKKSEAALAKFAGIEKTLPNSKTIDDVLNRLDHEEMNEVLMSIFETLRKSKFFSNHRQLTPNGFFHLAIDAETIHKYVPESSHNCEQCPYCLRRERAGTIWYLHVQVVASIVCPGNLRIPIYVYPIHSKSLGNQGIVSDEKFKQECELSAFSVILQKIRDRFPKLSFCILADSLYANGPSMEIVKKLSMEFMIVRKDGSMKTVGQDCDGLEKTSEHQNKNWIEKTSMKQGQKIKRSWSFFNDVEYQHSKLHILRFDEWIFDSGGIQTNYVHWEWIVSWKLTRHNAETTADRGRLRWLEEDLFNSVKNRGFEMQHDYSRNSNSQIIWSILIMLAFLITDLFSFVRQVTPLKRNRSLKDFMRSIFFDLCKLGEDIFCASILHRKIQIRYCLKARQP